MIKSWTDRIAHGENLSLGEAEEVFTQIAEGRFVSEELGVFLTALARKHETADEIAGAARAMRKFVRKIKVDAEAVLDVVGTGGDHKGTFNISTVSALVVAGAGVTVAKHGNRAVSSRCGSADVLEALGVNINVEPDVVERCLKEIGIGFLFAPKLHPAMAAVQPVRQALKARTIFNILGPLINPAFPTHQLLGVYDQRLLPLMAAALNNLGVKHAMVVCGEGGFDEVTTTGKTLVVEVKDSHLREYSFEPEKFGLLRSDAKDLMGKDIETNKHIALNILKGMEGPERDVVLFNAGCCLYLAGRCHTIKEGIALAGESIDSGHAIKKLNKLIEYTMSQ